MLLKLKYFIFKKKKSKYPDFCFITILHHIILFFLSGDWSHKCEVFCYTNIYLLIELIWECLLA